MSEDSDPRNANGNLGPRGGEGTPGSLPAGNDRCDPRDLIWGGRKRAIERRLRNLDPDLERYVREFAYGEIYARSEGPDGLGPKVQEFLAIAMLIALGNPTEIKTHLRGANNAGATEEELREVILFTVPYLGFPRAIGAMQMLREIRKP